MATKNGKRKPTELDGIKPIWTESDEMRLQDLFDNGSLSLDDSYSKIISLDDRFKKFNGRHMKTRLGRLRKSDASSSPVNVASSEVETSDVDECSMMCANMPFICFTYMDDSVKQEKVVILLDLPGGSRSYEWEFNDLGDCITLVVEWSSAFYDAFGMFESDSNDFRVQAMQDALKKKGISRNQFPKCCIQVPLGRKVCKDDSSWEVTVVNHKGSKILMIEFLVYCETAFKKLKRGNLADY